MGARVPPPPLPPGTLPTVLTKWLALLLLGGGREPEPACTNLQCGRRRMCRTLSRETFTHNQIFSRIT